MISAVHSQWQLDAPVLSLCINRNGDWVALAMGDGTVRLLPASDEAIEPKTVKMHEGVSLSMGADADEHAFLSGGDDGKVLILDPELSETTLLAEHPGRWIDHVASAPDGGLRAYNTGKTLHVLNEEGGERFGAPLELPGTPGDVAFSPNGKRLAASYYNGLSWWWTNAKEAKAETLEWKGSHLGLVWSPDSRVLLSSMQDGSLHGWQLSDGKEMQMQGYAAKVRSMAFTSKGRYLATSGAEQAVCWPFTGGGPWGKAPLTLGGTEGRLVTQVAPHPGEDMVAVGYSDGMIVLAPLDGRMEALISPPHGSQVNGLVWNAAGEALFAACESGTVQLFTIKSVRKALVQTS